MEHTFREGDMVIAVAAEECYGMTDEMRRALNERIPFRVVSANENCVVTLINGNTFNWKPRNLCHATEEAIAEGERQAAEEKKRLEEIMSKPGPELIKEAKKALRKSDLCRSNHNGVALHIRRNQPLTPESGPCHGFIRGKGSELSVAIITLVVRQGGGGYSERQCKREVLIAYYDWLLSRSPYSSCFFGRSGRKAVEKTVTALRVDVPANLLQGALICTRNTWEFPEAINLWYELVQKGVCENAAFVACHFVSRSGDLVRVTPVERDHISISTSRMTAEGLKAFLEGKALYKQSLYNEGGSYQGVHRAFLGGGEVLYAKLKKEFEKYGKESKTIRNPFALAKPQTSNVREMSVDKYASFVKDIFPKLIA